MQTGGVWKPPAGSTTKSRQAHMRWQQNGPTVVGTMQTKPFLQRGSFGSLLSPSDAARAIGVRRAGGRAQGSRTAGSLSAPGSRQTWDTPRRGAGDYVDGARSVAEADPDVAELCRRSTPAREAARCRVAAPLADDAVRTDGAFVACDGRRGCAGSQRELRPLAARDVVDSDQHGAFRRCRRTMAHPGPCRPPTFPRCTAADNPRAPDRRRSPP